MLWFKNAIVYQFGNDAVIEQNLIQKAVNESSFVPCGKTETTKSGWISPYQDAIDSETNNPSVLVTKDGQLLLRLKKEIKILPTSVVKQSLNEKITKQETELNRKLTKNEKSNLKEEVMLDLLPRAFSKFQFFWMWIDTQNKRLVIDCSSFKQAEDMISLLRQKMGSLPLIPLSSEIALENVMTDWVGNNIQYDPIELGNEIELKDSLEQNQIVRCKNQELTSNEILVHIDAGKQVNKLNIIDKRGVSFMLNSDHTLKRIKFDGEILDKNEDFMPEENNLRLEADFILMTNTLSTAISSLTEITNNYNK